MQKHSVAGTAGVAASSFHLLTVPVGQAQVKLIHNLECFLPGQVQFLEASLTEHDAMKRFLAVHMECSELLTLADGALPWC